MPEQKTFFGFVIEKYIDFLNELVQEPASFSLFKKPSLALETKSETDNAAFRTIVLFPDIKEENPGTFNCQGEEGRVYVFRNPSPFKLEIQVIAKPMAAKDQFRYFDKWFSYFFDNRSIDPFVPPFLASKTELYQKLKGARADIRILKSEHGVSFTYQHLYHSGNALREELKTRQRIIQIHEGVS